MFSDYANTGLVLALDSICRTSPVPRHVPMAGLKVRFEQLVRVTGLAAVSSLGTKAQVKSTHCAN